MRRILLVVATLVLGAAFVSPAQANHFFRGDGHGGTAGGCSPATGALSDTTVVPPTDATVDLVQASFVTPVIVIHPGQSVTWTWNSVYCHSVLSDVASQFNSGFHYPSDTPTSPNTGAPSSVGAYSVPELAPTLSYTHTFTTAGVYQYHCVHHVSIGMKGIVVVQ